MVGYPFSYKSPKGELSEVSYSVGNPMGFYSSWGSFALSHHFIIYDCCCKLGIEWSTAKYSLLGDDIVIGDERLAKLYLTRLADLGVEVSKAKTHVSNEFYEFAKRIIYKGHEVTPFPISALKESQKRYYLLCNLLLEVDGKGWSVEESISSSIGQLYGYLGMPSRFRKEIISKSKDCELIMKVMRGA